MGDNRDDSVDSRVSPVAGGVGLVPVENLVGRVDAILGSWDPIVRHDPVWTWPSGLRLLAVLLAGELTLLSLAALAV